MYISGTRANLEKRIHQLMASGSDIVLYQLEGNSYTYSGYAGIQLKNDLNREFKHSIYQISGRPTTGNYIR